VIKKTTAVFLVLLLSTTSLFAQTKNKSQNQIDFEHFLEKKFKTTPLSPKELSQKEQKELQSKSFLDAIYNNYTRSTK
jgi:hypothetical protein